MDSVRIKVAPLGAENTTGQPYASRTPTEAPQRRPIAMTSTEQTSDEMPTRFYMDDPNIKWRYGKPNYSAVNQRYLKEKLASHKADSFAKLIENIVKTWEMEAAHKENIDDWGSVDKEKFQMVINGKETFDGKRLFEYGSYNAFLVDCPFYNGKEETFDSSHKLFKRCFNKGYAWEVLELFSGPPRVSLTWRHWSHFTGNYGDHKPTGELLEMIGAAVITLNDKNQMEKLELYYDPNPTIMALKGIKCPVSA